jgi:hypothetical protein
MDIMKINLPVVGNSVTINVSPVSLLLDVTNVPKTELLNQIVTVKPDTLMLVMLYVKNVTGDVMNVMITKIVLYVTLSDIMLQLVHVLIHTMKKKIHNLVNHVTQFVPDVPIPHIIVPLVLV